MKKIIISILIISLVVIFILTAKNSTFMSKKEIETTKIHNSHLPINNDNLINRYLIDYFNIYPDFKDILKKAYIKLPNDLKMVPQGITLMNEYILITAYNSDNISKSMCYVLDRFGSLINAVKLDNASHVGSISYDSINDLLWIPGDEGTLNAYEASLFLKEEVVFPKYQYTNVSDGLINFENKKQNAISFLTLKDNYIYIGSFQNTRAGKVKKYQIFNENNNVTLKYIQELTVPTLVQGMTFYTINNQDYLIFSRSWGHKNSSLLTVVEYKENIKDYTKRKKLILLLPPLIEQITISNNELYAIFESNSSKYENTIEKINEICVFDLEIIINKFLNNS